MGASSYGADIDTLRLWLSPEPSPLRAAMAFTFERDAAEESSAGNGQLGFARFHGEAQGVFQRSATDEILFSTTVNREELFGAAALPNSDAWPEVLQSLTVGSGVRWYNDAGWVGGLQGKAIASGPESVGSRGFSDVLLTGFLRVPDGPHTAWVASLQYETQHLFWKYDFLPGIGYLVNPDEHLWLVIGLPWSALWYQPSDLVTVSATVGDAAHAEIDVALTSVWSLGCAWDWRQDAYRSNGRSTGELLVSHDIRWSANVAWTPASWCEGDIAGGFAFMRRLSVGETEAQGGHEQISISPGPFLQISLDVHF